MTAGQSPWERAWAAVSAERRLCVWRTAPLKWNMRLASLYKWTYLYILPESVECKLAVNSVGADKICCCIQLLTSPTRQRMSMTSLLRMLLTALPLVTVSFFVKRGHPSVLWRCRLGSGRPWRTKTMLASIPPVPAPRGVCSLGIWELPLPPKWPENCNGWGIEFYSLNSPWRTSL